MKAATFLVALALAALVIAGCGVAEANQHQPKYPVAKTDAEWKKSLTPEQYRILREKDTEAAFDNKYWNNHATGIYVCAACGNELFSSKNKFNSGTGWPSFWAPIRKDAVGTLDDKSWAVEERTEVVCARCGGHLGHVFDDGPKPSGLRYCMNSAAMIFKPTK